MQTGAGGGRGDTRQERGEGDTGQERETQAVYETGQVIRDKRRSRDRSGVKGIGKRQKKTGAGAGVAKYRSGRRQEQHKEGKWDPEEVEDSLGRMGSGDN